MRPQKTFFGERKRSARYRGKVSMKNMVLSFNEMPAKSQLIAGGNGSALAQLYQAGYRVPDGFVISAATQLSLGPLGGCYHHYTGSWLVGQQVIAIRDRITSFPM